MTIHEYNQYGLVSDVFMSDKKDIKYIINMIKIKNIL